MLVLEKGKVRQGGQKEGWVRGRGGNDRGKVTGGKKEAGRKRGLGVNCKRGD